MGRKILLPLDGSERAETVLAFLPPFVVEGKTTITLLQALPQADEKSESSAMIYLQDVARRLRPLKAKLVPRIVVGDAAVKITQEADSMPADLVVLSTHGKTGNGGAGRFLGELANSLCHSCPHRLLLVRPQAKPRERRPLTAVCPIDSYANFERLERELTSLFADTKATIHLVRVGRPFQWSLGGIPPVSPQTTQQMQAEIVRLAGRLAERHVHIEPHVTRGEAVEETRKAVEELKADLVLAQTHRVLLFGWRLGPLATYLLSETELPVVLLR
jgi:nucleotide-binding universal stress UspA family protein